MKKCVIVWLISGGALLAGSSARQRVTFSVIPSTGVAMTNSNWVVESSQSQFLKVQTSFSGRTNIVTVTEK